jgi:hypothetical protein
MDAFWPVKGCIDTESSISILDMISKVVSVLFLLIYGGGGGGDIL